MKISLLIISLTIAALSINKETKKMIDKEITKVFKTETYSLEAASFSKTKEINGEFFIIKSNKAIGYLYLGKILENSEYFLIFNQNKMIEKIKISSYKEDYGLEMCSNAWLKQFVNKDEKKNYCIGKNINAISGATVSSKEVTEDINRINIFLNKQQ